jgi:gliding motility-associated-like protein
MARLMRKQVVFIFLCLWLQCTAQQNNTWYFGSTAGISFNPTGNGPIPFSLPNSAMDASEGCSSICDANGNMLMYTNGRTIYDRNNKIMLNGDNLLGHPSAFQPAIVVQLPNSNHIYYVFTADAFENNFANGYRYSIVDMNMDNGNGAVTTKNILLHAPSSERLTAARHANGIDVWIITNDSYSNVFRVWLLTCTGLQPNEVVSTSGTVLDQHTLINTGAMKVSPDGTQLCQTHFPDPGQTTENFFQLFDFNNSTGIISNPKIISIPQCRYYANEFSPDSKLLYLTKADGNEIDQFECKLSTIGAIAASRIPIPAIASLCGLQLGPDEKIYVTHNATNLSVISNPNTKDIGCGFQAGKVDLAGNFGSLNLPSFVNDMPVNVYNYFTTDVVDTCAGTIQFNGHTNLSGTISWSWDFGDGSTSINQNPQHSFVNIKQIYTVKLKITSSVLCGFVEKTKIISPGGLLVHANFDAISICDSGFVRFTNKSTFFPEYPEKYEWNFGDGSISSDTSPVHIYQNPGLYNVKLKVKTNASCLDDSLIIPVNFVSLNIQASPDQVINEGQSIQLNVTGGGTVFHWQPPTSLSNPDIANPVATPLDDITYIVTATNNGGCKDVDSVFIKVNPNTDIFVPAAFTPNNDGKNDILKPVMSTQFTLQTFSIYNRWGQNVFTTVERGKGWDGKFGGELQPAAVYIWVLKLADRHKKITEKKGTVMLIR